MPLESTMRYASERYLPDHHFAVRHSIGIRGRAATILAAVAAFDPLDDPVARRLMSLREWPARLLGTKPAGKAPFGLHEFTLLERSEQDMAYGLVGRFWTSNFGLVPIVDAERFKAFDEVGAAKLVMSFETNAVDAQMTGLTTRTRIFCPDLAARRRLAFYWSIIRPVSGLLRRRMLMRIRKTAESANHPLR